MRGAKSQRSERNCGRITEEIAWGTVELEVNQETIGRYCGHQVRSGGLYITLTGTYIVQVPISALRAVSHISKGEYVAILRIDDQANPIVVRHV